MLISIVVFMDNLGGVFRYLYSAQDLQWLGPLFEKETSESASDCYWYMFVLLRFTVLILTWFCRQCRMYWINTWDYTLTSPSSHVDETIFRSNIEIRHLLCDWSIAGIVRRIPCGRHRGLVRLKIFLDHMLHGVTRRHYIRAWELTI